MPHQWQRAVSTCHFTFKNIIQNPMKLLNVAKKAGNYWVLGIHLFLIVILFIAAYCENYPQSEKKPALTDGPNRELILKLEEPLSKKGKKNIADLERLEDTIFRNKVDAQLKYFQAQNQDCSTAIDTYHTQYTQLWQNQMDEQEKKSKNLSVENDTLFKKAIKRLQANSATLQKLEMEEEKPKTWTLMFLIVLSGFLGGIARTRAKDLSDDPEFQVKKADEAAADLMAQMDDGQQVSETLTKTEIKNRVAEIRAKLASAKNALADDVNTPKAPKDENRARDANLIYGTIAALVAFLVLGLSDSNILEFNHSIDYFTFTAWCVLGAVFAKNWIRTAYERGKENTEKPKNATG